MVSLPPSMRKAWDKQLHSKEQFGSTLAPFVQWGMRMACSKEYLPFSILSALPSSPCISEYVAYSAVYPSLEQMYTCYQRVLAVEICEGHFSPLANCCTDCPDTVLWCNCCSKKLAVEQSGIWTLHNAPRGSIPVQQQ